MIPSRFSAAFTINPQEFFNKRTNFLKMQAGQDLRKFLHPFVTSEAESFSRIDEDLANISRDIIQTPQL